MIDNSITIILCFYNAESKLPKTLQAIKAIKVPPSLSVELILVNNNSNDNSLVVIQNELEAFKKFPYKVVTEKVPGLSHARKKGISESGSELLLFCDDDNWLASDYLEKGVKILSSNSKIAVLGGLGEPISDVKIPSWFESVQNFYAVGPQAELSGEVAGKRNVVYGAGMWVRKSTYLKIMSLGFDFHTLGRVGNQLSSGEDSELCLAFRIAGYKIWYSTDLQFKHYIEKIRLTDNYFRSLKKGMNRSRFVTRFYLDYLYGYSPVVNKYFWVKEFFYNLKDSVINLFLVRTDGLIRNFQFGIYLLQEKQKYNDNVQKMVLMCQKLSQNKNHN